jgi:hypothetical protein
MFPKVAILGILGDDTQLVHWVSSTFKAAAHSAVRSAVRWVESVARCNSNNESIAAAAAAAALLHCCCRRSLLKMSTAHRLFLLVCTMGQVGITQFSTAATLLQHSTERCKETQSV